MNTLRRFRRLSWLTILALILGFGVTLGISQAAAGQAAAGKTLIVALDQSDLKTLDPGRIFEFASEFIDLNCYDTLVAHKSGTDLNTFVPVLGLTGASPRTARITHSSSGRTSSSRAGTPSRRRTSGSASRGSRT